MPRPIPSSSEIIERAKLIHGNKYDYSLTKYISWKDKIIIICRVHGEFSQKINKHINSKQGCPKCNNKNVSSEEFISKAKLIHGDLYDYSLVEYKTAKTKIQIRCNIHGAFKCTPNNHLNGKGCPICSGSFLDLDLFINKANKKHNFIYDYSIVEYNKSNENINIICSKHGIFEQTPNNHLRGQGCPKCRLSKGELRIENWLATHNIKFQSQKRFSDCRNKQPLPFDFYLPEHNICIEFDGEQHTTPYRYKTDGDKFTKRFEQTKLHDEIKNTYCELSNLKLIRISYKNFNIIDTILGDNII